MSVRAFTLIEVLIAIIVIGLGSVGIFALLAGTAEQQRRASELTESVGLTQNAAAMLETNFGRLGPPPSGVETLAQNVWYQVVCRPGGSGGFDHYQLTINPYDIDSPTLTQRGRFFVIDGEEEVIFENPGAETAPGSGMYLPEYGGSIPFGAANLGTLVTVREVADLQRGRIHPGSVEVIFGITREDGASRSVTFNDAYQNSLDPQDEVGDLQSADVPVVMGEDLRFNYAEDTALIGEKGRIQDFNLTATLGLSTTSGSREWISRLTVRYAWRNDRLLGLSDRIMTTPDPDFPDAGNRRAEYGFTVFYRTLDSGTAQMAVVTYSLIPERRNTVFVPPETLVRVQADAGLVREVRVDLLWDAQTQRYALTGPRDNDEWALEPGQILLARRTADNSQPGADNEVRVVSQIRRGSQTLALLDDAPRVGGRPLVQPIDGPRTTIDVLALHPVATSLADDSAWRVRPIEIRQFQVIR